MGRVDESAYCPDCQEESEIIVDQVEGHCVCNKCGLVVELQFIDDSHDVRIYEANQSAQRIEIANSKGGGEIASITINGRLRTGRSGDSCRTDPRLRLGHEHEWNCCGQSTGNLQRIRGEWRKYTENEGTLMLAGALYIPNSACPAFQTFLDCLNEPGRWRLLTLFSI